MKIQKMNVLVQIVARLTLDPRLIFFAGARKIS